MSFQSYFVFPTGGSTFWRCTTSSGHLQAGHRACRGLHHGSEEVWICAHVACQYCNPGDDVQLAYDCHNEVSFRVAVGERYRISDDCLLLITDCQLIADQFASWHRHASVQEQVFLKAIVAEFQRTGVEETVFSKVYQQHVSLCRFEGELWVLTGIGSGHGVESPWNYYEAFLSMSC